MEQLFFLVESVITLTFVWLEIIFIFFSINTCRSQFLSDFCKTI